MRAFLYYYCFLLLFPFFCFAQDTLTKDDVINSVLNHHPLIKAVNQELSVAEGEMLSAQGAFDTVIRGDSFGYMEGYYSGSQNNLGIEQPLEFMGSKVFTGYRKSTGTFPIYENQYETDDSGEWRAGIEIPILRDNIIDRRRTDLGKALLGQIISINNIEQRKIELKRAASIIYWDWVAARRRKETLRDLLEVAEKRDLQIEKRVNTGDLPSFDRTDNQRALLQRKSQLVLAEAQLQRTEFDLSLFFRDENGAPKKIQSFAHPKDFPNPTKLLFTDNAIYQDKALVARPELKKLDKQMEQIQIELNLTKNQLLPKLDLQMQASKDLGGRNDSYDEQELKAGLKFEMPFQRRVSKGKQQALRGKQEELKNLKEFASQKIITEVKDALIAIQYSEERLKIARNEVKAAIELESGERKKLELGDSNLIFVNLREQITADAKIRIVDAASDYWKARANLEASLAE